MGAFVSDTFTGTAGTDLTAHTPDIGSAWADDLGGPTIISNANRARRDTTAPPTKYRNTTTPPSADYSVEADFFVASVLASDFVTILGRLASGADTYYQLGTDGSNWFLYKCVAGAQTQIGSSAQTLVASNTYHAKLTMAGTSITCFVAGSQIISVTDSAVTAAGFAGLKGGYGGAATGYSDTTGIHYDNFVASVPDVSRPGAGIHVVHPMRSAGA